MDQCQQVYIMYSFTSVVKYVLSIVKQYARVLCIRKRDWQEKVFIILIIHTGVHLSYAVLRLPRNKCKFLQINTKQN